MRLGHGIRSVKVDSALLQDMAWLDWVGLAITGLLLTMGLIRGLWWQLIRFMSIVLSAIVARLFAADGAAWIAEIWPELGPRLAHGAAWVSVFALTLTAATVLGHIGQKLIDAMQLGLANRLAGGAMGALTGLSIHMALLLSLSFIGTETFVSRNVAGTYSEDVYQAVGDRWQVVLGAEAAGELRRLLSGEDTPPRPEGQDSGATPGVR